MEEEYFNCMHDISDNAHFKVRRAFVRICNGNSTQALILGVLEAKTNERMAMINRLRAKKNFPPLDTVKEFDPRDLIIRMPFEDWKAASFGVLSRFLINKESFALANAGFIRILQHQNKRDRAFFYQLQIQTIIVSIRALDGESNFGFHYLSK